MVVGASPRRGNDARSKSTSAEYFTRRREGTHTMYAGPLRSVPEGKESGADLLTVKDFMPQPWSQLI